MTRPRSRSTRACWAWMVGVLLLAWAARLCLLEEVPPGWRDDELIEIHVLAAEVLAGHFPLYFTGASGHEPLYHYLQAGLNVLLGYNVLSGHLLSVIFGTLSVGLTYVVGRQLLRSCAAALLAAGGLALSFWGLMYSRFHLRQISAVTFALLFVYWLWRMLDRPRPRLRDALPPGLALGVGFYTYFASRVMPVLLAVLSLYLLLFHRSGLRRLWHLLALTFALGIALAVPLALAIGSPADARIRELAAPLYALAAGDARPLLETTWKTLGMFHATGDPEWLYNIAGRPLFNLPGALLFALGVGIALRRWRQPRAALLLLWLALGVTPACISIPAASLSHTIGAQPAVYLLLGGATIEVARWVQRRTAAWGVDWTRHGARWLCLATLAAIWVTNIARDLRDYFVAWPQQDLVRYLYRADTRAAGQYFAAHPDITDVAVASMLFGPWDRVALEVDSGRPDLRARFFNPQRALVWPAEGTPRALLTFYPPPEPPIADWLAAQPGACTPLAHSTARLCTLPAPAALGGALAGLALPERGPLARFANGLTLLSASAQGAAEPEPGAESTWITLWQVAQPLTLPPMPLVAYPPPPGVYAGPRLAVFAHLLGADGTLAATDDGLWVDPVTLEPGDRFAQVYRFALAAEAPAGPYCLALGLYDPFTGERWSVVDDEGQALGSRVLVDALGSGVDKACAP